MVTKAFRFECSRKHKIKAYSKRLDFILFFYVYEKIVMLSDLLLTSTTCKKMQFFFFNSLIYPNRNKACEGTTTDSASSLTIHKTFIKI